MRFTPLAREKHSQLTRVIEEDCIYGLRWGGGERDIYSPPIFFEKSKMKRERNLRNSNGENGTLRLLLLCLQYEAIFLEIFKSTP